MSLPKTHNWIEEASNNWCDIGMIESGENVIVATYIKNPREIILGCFESREKGKSEISNLISCNSLNEAFDRKIFIKTN